MHSLAQILSSFRFSLAHTASFLSHDARIVNGLFTPFGSSMVFSPPSVPPFPGGQKRFPGDRNHQKLTLCSQR